jgi:hypothetical protein
MKKKDLLNIILIYSVLFIPTVFGKSEAIVFPDIFVSHTSIQVRIWNYTENNIVCSGNIFTYSQRGISEVLSFFDFIPSKMTSFRTLFPRLNHDTLLSLTHSIVCH